MVGKDKIEITAELKDLLTGQLKNIQAEAAKLDNTLKNIGNGGAIGGKDVAGGGMQQSMMGSVLGANLLTQGIGMATSAIKDFAVSSVDSYMKNEMYEARLTTLLHGREQALSALSQITKDAALTPFDKEALVQGNSMLIGAGESAAGARKAVMDLGNAIAATGGGSDELNRMSVNLAQIKSVGKASALDVKQFMYANIPIYDMLAKSMHKNANEIKGMDISYKDLTKALADARKEGGMFYQGLENANKTLSGQLSNLGDSWEQLKVNIGDSQSGILKMTASWASSMLNEINNSFDVENKLSRAFKKYGAKEYTTAENVFGSRDKITQSVLQSNIDKELLTGVDTKEKASWNMAILKQMEAKMSSGKSLELYGKEGQERNLAILKGAFNELSQIRADLVKPKDAEGKDASKESKASDLEKVAKANRPTQVNINIENLVREYTNQINTASEGEKLTHEKVAKALISAVNDISNLNYT